MKRKTHSEFINDVYKVSQGEYTVLGSYKNNKTKILMRHNYESCNNYEWDIKPNNFLEGEQRCPICSKKEADEMHRTGIDTFKKEIKSLVNNEYEVIGDIYINSKTNIKMKHIICGNEFDVTPNNFISKNSRCPKCALKLKAERLRKTIEQVNFEIYNEVKGEYELVSNNYINNNEKILIRHNKCGNILEVSLANFIYSGTRCECETQSKGEKGILDYLKNNDIKFIYQYKFEDCKNIKKLSFDFYLYEHNYLIEFQGRQHYMPVSIFGGEEGFVKQIKNDNIKRKYCQTKNIKLLEISYLNLNNINLILDNQINNHDNTVPRLAV